MKSQEITRMTGISAPNFVAIHPTVLETFHTKPHGDARWRVRGSSKSLVTGTFMPIKFESVHRLGIHPIAVEIFQSGPKRQTNRLRGRETQSHITSMAKKRLAKYIRQKIHAPQYGNFFRYISLKKVLSSGTEWDHHCESKDVEYDCSQTLTGIDGNFTPQPRQNEESLFRISVHRLVVHGEVGGKKNAEPSVH